MTKVSMFNFELGSDSILVTVITNEVLSMTKVYSQASFSDSVNERDLSLGHDASINLIKSEMGVS